MKIRVNPHNVKIVREETEPINELEVNVSKCEFEFDEKITNEFVKEAYFTLNGSTYKQIIVNNECEYPNEVLTEKGTLEIGVVAYKVVNGQELIRYNPSPDYYDTWVGSLKDAENTEPITPTDKEQMQSQITQNAANISNLQTSKQDKLTAGDNITIDENNVISAVDTIYDDTEIKADIQELQQTKIDKNVNNLTYYTLTTETGSKITLSIDSSTYIMTLKLKDKNNNDISTANVDLPLETMVVGARYDSAAKEIVLTLKNGQEVRFSVADLVSGLQTEITENNKLSSDLVDDTNNTNKFVSASEKTQITTNKNDITAIKDGEEIDSFADVEIALGLKEDKSNKVTEINSSSTDTQYPSAKCVYDSQEEQNEQIAELEMLYNAFPTVSAENETIQLDNTAKVKFREIDLKGNTSQETIPEEQGTSVSNTSIYVSDVNTDKESSIEMSGNTYQETTTGANVMPVVNVTKTVNGVTITNNENGTITLNGTATAQVVYPITNTGNNTTRRVPVTENDYKFMLYGDTNVSNDTYFLQVLFGTETETTKFFAVTDNGATSLHIETDRSIGYGLIIRNGQSFNNHIIKPMGVLSTYTGGFEPYTYGASPNPSYPQNIEVVTGTQNVEVCGKNLFDKNNTTIGAYINSTNEQVSASGWAISDYIRVNENETYTYQGLTTVGTAPYSAYYDKNKNFISSFKQAIGTNTITIPNNAYYVRFSMRNTTEHPNPTTFMIEKGSTSSTYEEYIGTTYPVNLGNIELCKIDTYQDRIYKKNDKWYLYKETGKVVLNGSESWNTRAGETLYAYQLSNVFDGNKTNGLSTHWQFISGGAMTTQNKECMASANTNASLSVFTNNSYLNTITNFTTWLSTHNTVVYYVLTTPTTTEITDTNLVNQLNALYNATIYPITNINTDTSNLLPYIDLHYNFVTPSPSPSRPSVVNVVKGNNTLTISNSDNTESQVFPINLGDIELCKIGTYQDYIYENNGNWFKKGNINKNVVNTNNVTLISSYTNIDYAAIPKQQDDIGYGIYSNAETFKCNVGKYISSPTWDSNTNIGRISGAANKTAYWLGFEKGTSLDTIKTILANDNATMYYTLATPTDTQITDTTLITQLNNIKKAYSYDTQTNISQTNTDKPFIIYAEAIRSLKDVFE